MLFQTDRKRVNLFLNKNMTIYKSLPTFSAKCAFRRVGFVLLLAICQLAVSASPSLSAENINIESQKQTVQSSTSYVRAAHGIGEGYDPENPGDPSPENQKLKHSVVVKAIPTEAGSFSPGEVFDMEENETRRIYAYPNNGWWLTGWTINGEQLKTTAPFVDITMGEVSLDIKAHFTYSPTSPLDPAANFFNSVTGEAIVDRFQQGYLSNAISLLLGQGYRYSDIRSLLVTGMMDASDFGVMYRLANCSVIDLSRTNGYVEIPSSAFRSLDALTELILPLCVDSIGRDAFKNCRNLAIITCYAPIPPELADGVFDGVDDSVVIKVPAQSVYLYKNAAGWMDFTILPADANVYSITVSLPSDAGDGRYKNMSIELLNTSNGQRYKYLITDKVEYVFGNLLSSTKYSVYVKNAKNEILGEITDLEIVDSDLSASFQSLLQPGNISIKVLTPDGRDITKDVTIKWFNEANELLQQGSLLSGVLENSVVYYTVSLPQQLQNIYLHPASTPFKVSGSISLTCTLEAIGKTVLTGKISDTVSRPISTAILTISQKINGTYTNSVNAHCDNDGNYSIELPDVPVKVTVSANGYISRTKELQSASVGIGDVVLDKNTGITVYSSYTFKESVTAGEEADDAGWYSDDANIAYRIEDLDGNEITGCIYQAGSIVLPASIEIGDEIKVIAYSKSNRFKDVSQTLVVNSKSNYVQLQIVEYGGIQVTVNDEEAPAGICMLYDATGKQIGRSTFRNNTVSFNSLPDGQYTLISMQKSSLLGSVSNLSSFQETQLVQGSDYLLDKVNVVSGRITDIAIADIPDLDETKLYYTNSKETYFMPNKSQLTIGNYLTLKAKMTIKDEYAGDIDAATLIVDIPSNCEFVDNSVISGAGYLGYEYAGNRLSIPVHNLSDAVRFCIIPLEGGECKPSAFVKLIVDNKEVLQPIGSAYFQAKNFSLTAPKVSSKTNIAISGTAASNSEVLIYDNETLVGSTYSMANGEWSLNISLHKPYSKSIHNIYGEIIAYNGKRLLTQSRTIDYDQNYVDLSKVTMLYGSVNIVFDHLNSRNTANWYSYVPGRPDFTFVADFSENNPEKISNVVIKVLASDGSVRSLPAEYNPATGNWMACTKYANSTKLPVNATVEYDLLIQRIFDDQDRINQENTLLNDVVESYITALNERELIIKNETENSCTLDFVNLSDDVLHITIRQISLDQIPSDDNALNIPLDNETIYLNTFSNDSGYVIYVWNRDLAYMISFFESQDESTTMLRSPSRAWWNNWGDFGRGIDRGLNSVPILGNRDLVKACDDYNYWENRYIVFMNNHIGYNKLTTSLLLAKCDDGELKLSKTALEWYEMYKCFYADDCSRFETHMREMLDKYYSSIWWRSRISAGLQAATLGATWYLSRLNGSFVQGAEALVNWLTKSVVGQITNHIAIGGITGAVSGVVGDVSTDSWVGNYLARYCEEEERKIRENYIELNENIKTSYRKCPKDDEDDDTDGGDDGNNDFPTPPITPSIDPSGYVYEAVPSNRIQGVTATAYYKQQTEDMYGDITETAVVWDAAPFNQENPLTTDAQGMYAWDVPAGMWQVRFEKEGYEPAQSEWLPVPPPQLDVNIAMTQSKQPEVKTVHAYSDGVVIEFDKFMLPSTLTSGNITVTQNGSIVSGVIEGSDIEFDAKGNAFCSKIEYKPDAPLEEGEAMLFISKAVKSYANINMSEDFTQSFTVEPRVSEIKVSQNIEVNSGSSIKVFASVLPASAAQGKVVLVESINPMVAVVSSGSVETDETGKISFDVTGQILGNTSIRLSIEGYDVEAVITVNVLTPRDENQVATPYASIESGEVKVGTEVYLYCETENASIYYTTDGSCPCDVNRQKYDGSPVIVDKDITLRVMAEADEMIESEIAEYHYSVISTGVEEAKIDKNISFYPLPLGEYLNISNGDFPIESVSIFDVSGNLMVHSSKSEKQVSLKVGFLSPGIYILSVESNGQSIIKKVVKQ